MAPRLAPRMETDASVQFRFAGLALYVSGAILLALGLIGLYTYVIVAGGALIVCAAMAWMLQILLRQREGRPNASHEPSEIWGESIVGAVLVAVLVDLGLARYNEPAGGLQWDEYGWIFVITAPAAGLVLASWLAGRRWRGRVDATTFALAPLLLLFDIAYFLIAWAHEQDYVTWLTEAGCPTVDVVRQVWTLGGALIVLNVVGAAALAQGRWGKRNWARFVSLLALGVWFPFQIFTSMSMMSCIGN